MWKQKAGLPFSFCSTVMECHCGLVTLFWQGLLLLELSTWTLYPGRDRINKEMLVAAESATVCWVWARLPQERSSYMWAEAVYLDAAGF